MQKKATPYKPYPKEMVDRIEQINLSLYRLNPGCQNMTLEEMKELMKKQDITIEVTFLKKQQIKNN